MLALNSRQLSLLLFVVCHNHICSCYCRAPNNGRGLNIDGAWRIIMPRLTLARAVGRAHPINGRAAPHRLQIKLPATRCTVLHEGTRNVCLVHKHGLKTFFRCFLNVAGKCTPVWEHLNLDRLKEVELCLFISGFNSNDFNSWIPVSRM